MSEKSFKLNKAACARFDDKDEDGDDDDDGDEGDESMSVVEGDDLSDDSLTESSGTEDDDDDKDKCPICLNRFRNNNVATPDNCQHTFCFDCISEWSTNTNTCPIDRQTFRFILIKSQIDGPVVRKVPVKDKNYDSDQVEEDDEDRTFCEACGQANREERLLLCDGCDKGYHLECLTPPLNEVPIHEWFCSACDLRNQQRDQRAVAARRRAIPRTRATERVRNRIAHRVIQVLSDYEDLLSDDDRDMFYELNDGVQPSTSSSVKPKRRIKRRFRRRRRTVKRPTSSRSAKTQTISKKRRRRRRKGRRKSRIARPTLRRTFSDPNLFDFLNRDRLPDVGSSSQPTSTSNQNKTIKSRLAEHLGIIPPKKEFLQPKIRSKQVGETSFAGASTFSSLSLFGNNKELIAFEDESDDERENENLPQLSKKAQRFNQPLSSKTLKKRTTNTLLNQKENVEKHAAKENVKVEKHQDLLGSIFEGQSLLLRKSESLVVRRDGSLQAKKVNVDESFVDNKAALSTNAVVTSNVDKRKIHVDDPNSSDVVSESSCTAKKKYLSKEEKSETKNVVAHVNKKEMNPPIIDDSNRIISLDNRIEALVASHIVTPQQLPHSVASQLGLREGQIRRKVPLLPHPTASINETYAELMSKVLQSGPPPPPPPPLSSSAFVGNTSVRQVPAIYSRSMQRPKLEPISMDSNVQMLVGAHPSIRFPAVSATSNTLVPNLHIPPPPPSILPPPTSMNTYAAPAFMPGIHRQSLPVRLPFPFAGQDLTQSKFVVPSTEQFLIGPTTSQQMSAFRWTVPPTTAVRVQTATGSTVVHVPTYPQVPLPLFAQPAPAGAQSAFQPRSNLLLNQYAAAFPELASFALHNAAEQSSHRVNPYGIDVQALTGSGLVMHHQIPPPVRIDDDVPPAAPEIKTPVPIPIPPEEPTVPPPPSPSVRLDLKDPTIPQELLGLLAQFAQMKNEQSQREALLIAKKGKLGSSNETKPSFEPSPVKKPDIFNTANVSPQVLPMQISNDGDSPFSPASSSSGDAYSPDDIAAPVVKPARTVQFHPEVEDKNNEERLSKSEKRQLRSEEKLKSLLLRTAAQNNCSSNEDDGPSSAVDLRRRERLLAKFNYQLRVEEEVKMALKPYYSKRRITKEQYKNIMRKTVPKICKKKAEINPVKIHSFVDSYVQKMIGASTMGSKIKKEKARKSEDDD